MSLRRKKVRKLREGVMTLILSGKNLWLETEQAPGGREKRQEGRQVFPQEQGGGGRDLGKLL